MLAMLVFGAASASAGLLTGFPDANTGKTKAATIFLFLAWFALLPTVYLNGRNVSGPW